MTSGKTDAAQRVSWEGTAPAQAGHVKPQYHVTEGMAVSGLAGKGQDPPVTAGKTVVLDTRYVSSDAPAHAGQAERPTVNESL